MNEVLKNHLDREFQNTDSKIELYNAINQYTSKILNKKKQKQNIKLFLTDVDGVLTDAGMYYTEFGDEFKKFNTRDGKGLELLRKTGVKTGIITSEDTNIVTNRAKKLKVDFLFQGAGNDKLKIISKLCVEENISFSEIAYIGDDINDLELLSTVGLAACPQNAVDEIKSIRNIHILNSKGGEGAVREFIENFIL